jgi:hypothetical protein
MNKNKRIISSIIVLVFAGVLIGYGIHEANKNTAAPQAASIPDTSAPHPAAIASTTSVIADTTKRTNKYKNGTYSATGTYDSPGGSESIGVSLTITNDTVTGASVTPMPNDGTSARYQQSFISGYKTYVIGENIDTIALDIVSGSSLTPVGFNDALSKIKAEAQA